MSFQLNEPIYTTGDVGKIFGIKRPVVHEWIKCKFIQPTIPSYRIGTINKFTFLDVLRTKLFSMLVDKSKMFNFTRKHASKICWSIKSNKIIEAINKKPGDVDILILIKSYGDNYRVEFVYAELGKRISIDKTSNILNNIIMINYSKLEADLIKIIRKKL